MITQRTFDFVRGHDKREPLLQTPAASRFHTRAYRCECDGNEKRPRNVAQEHTEALRPCERMQLVCVEHAQDRMLILSPFPEISPSLHRV